MDCMISLSEVDNTELNTVLIILFCKVSGILSTQSLGNYIFKDGTNQISIDLYISVLFPTAGERISILHINFKFC